MVPVFEYIPIFGDTSKAELAVVSISGISTKHDDTHTDRGRLYGSITGGGSYTLNIYSSVTRDSGSLVLSGTVGAVGQYFNLTAQNTSGMTARALIKSYTADDAGLIFIPTFAVDIDVMISASACATMPGYDATYGLAYFHAMAMREILTTSLPGVLPNLFGGKGLASFVPTSSGIELPDLTRLANIDQLRVAQSDLVKGLSARDQEHTAEFAAMMKAAFARFDATMKNIGMINKAEDIAEKGEEAEASGVSVAPWSRV